MVGFVVYPKLCKTLNNDPSLAWYGLCLRYEYDAYYHDHGYCYYYYYYYYYYYSYICTQI